MLAPLLLAGIIAAPLGSIALLLPGRHRNGTGPAPQSGTAPNPRPAAGPRPWIDAGLRPGPGLLPGPYSPHGPRTGSMPATATRRSRRTHVTDPRHRDTPGRAGGDEWR